MLYRLISNFSLDYLLQFLLSILVLLFSLSWHEAAHAWMAKKLGDDTAERAGRLTLNPAAHLSFMGTMMMLLASIGWAQGVPVNPNNFREKYRGKKGWMLTAFAGPLSNLILVVIGELLLSIYLFILQSSSLGMNARWSGLVLMLFQLFYQLITLNLFLAIFNLLPIPPLDGFKIFGGLLPYELYQKVLRWERQIGLVALMIILFFPSLVDAVLSRLATPFMWILSFPFPDSLKHLLAVSGLL